MPWDGYEVDGDGAFTFLDSSNGRRMRTAPVPSAQELAAELDAAKAPAAPMTPAPMPVESVVVDTSPMMRRDLAQEAPSAADQGAPGAAGAAPPPEAPPPPGPEGAGGAPQAPAAGAPPAAAPAPAPPPAVGPGNIIFKPGMSTAGMSPEQLSAYLYWQAAQQELKGSPGVFVKGGTFPTGSTEQLSRGPDPGATLGREAAERRLGNAQSDLIYVQSRAAEEQALNAQEQARIAADRQKQIEEINARQQAKLGQIFEQIDTTSKELADAKVDPNRWVNSLSTGEQIMAGLAMVFGGAGRGLTGEQGPPLAMQAFDDAIRGDIENQKYAIEKKRGDLNALGTTYRLAFEKFGDEKLASEAAYLAGLEIVKAKIAKTVAEADAAQGTETQWSDGQIVAGPPYSIKAKAMLAQLAVDQAKIRESLSQAANGQVTQQYVTTPDKVTGGRAPNYAKAAELSEKAGKALGGDERQQVMYDGQRFALGKFAESGEGKQTREELGKIENAKQQASKLEAYLKENPVGSRTFDKSRVDGLLERLSSAGNVILGQGAKNNDEAKRWQQILTGVFTNGVAAVGDMNAWLDDLAKRKLDQLNAKPLNQGPGIAPPQGLQDIATGRAKVGGAGVVGLPRAPSSAPAPATIVRNNGALASPLDRATAAAVQAKTGEGKARESAATLARAALKSALASGQLGQGEYKTALGLVDDGQYDELMGFLGRMGGSAGGPPPGPRRPAVDPATQMMLNRSIRETTQALSGGPSVKTVVTTKTGKR